MAEQKITPVSAMLKRAESWQQDEKTHQARDMYFRLVENFPDTDEAHKAEERLLTMAQELEEKGKTYRKALAGKGAGFYPVKGQLKPKGTGKERYSRDDPKECFKMRQYIYGVITTSQPATFGQSLLSSSPEPVYTIVHSDLAGVVSNYNRGDFASLSREDKLWCLTTHQKVIERVMKEGYSILPVKLGTLVEDEDAVRRSLEQGYKKLTQTLNQMSGMVEIEVAATWDLKKVLEEIGNEAEIRQLKHSVTGKSAPEILEIQMKAGRLVKESLDRRREGYLSQMTPFLAEIALDMQPNILVTDEMVMNVAFLVQRKKQADFESQVKRLNEAFNDQIHFRIIGPLPPYSFSTVEIKRPDPAKIEEARQRLGLGSDVSDKQLKESYRRLASKSHPDAHPDDNSGNEQFARVRQGFILLRDYCQGQSDSANENRNDQRYSLMPGDVSQTFLVEIKRPALQAG